MAKPDKPLLSLGATGTIADALTYQKRGQDTIARTKPIPTYRRTLPQQYQRWLYEDYAYLWTQQTEATKRQHAATGSRFHLTAFQYWIKYNLTNLPDIAGWWKFDEKLGAIAYDSSRNNNNGTIFGASPAAGQINGCLSFDGLNDNVNCGTPPTLYNPLFTHEFLLLIDNFSTHRAIISVGANVAAKQGTTLISHTTGTLAFYIGDGANYAEIIAPPGTILLDTWHHVCVTFDGTNMAIHVNGLLKKTGTQNPIQYDLTYSAIIGLYVLTGYPFSGKIDNVLNYNRVLDTTEIKRHSERRYPA